MFRFPWNGELISVALCSERAVEFFVFAADELFLTEAQRFAMIEVQEFMQWIRRRFELSEAFSVPMAQALAWMRNRAESAPGI